MMNKSEIEPLEKKLDILVRLFAMEAVRGREFREQVRILNQAGLQPKEIGELLNKSPNNISVTLNLMNKKPKEEV
jgi:hypothetical protein